MSKKNLWEKEKILVTSFFSFSYNLNASFSGSLKVVIVQYRVNPSSHCPKLHKFLKKKTVERLWEKEKWLVNGISQAKKSLSKTEIATEATFSWAPAKALNLAETKIALFGVDLHLRQNSLSSLDRRNSHPSVSINFIGFKNGMPNINQFCFMR